MEKLFFPLVVLAAAFIVWRFLVPRMENKQRHRVRDGAKKIVSTMEQAYSPDHEFAPVQPADFPMRDIAFYDRMAEALRGQGFIFLGDVEDVTISHTFPKNRTFIRILVSAERSAQAAGYDATPRGFIRFAAWLSGMRHFKVVELESELADGCFIVTTTAPRTPMEKPALIRALYLPSETPVERLIDEHRTHLEKVTRERGSKPLQPRTLSDVLASQKRQQRILYDFRKGFKFGLTEKEKEGFAQGISPTVTSQVFTEVDELSRGKNAE